MGVGGENLGPMPVLGGILDQVLSRPQTRISKEGPPLGDGEAKQQGDFRPGLMP